MFPTMVRWRVRSTQSSTTWLSSRTAIRDSCFVALMTMSRDMRGGLYAGLRVSFRSRGAGEEPPAWNRRNVAYRVGHVRQVPCGGPFAVSAAPDDIGCE